MRRPISAASPCPPRWRAACRSGRRAGPCPPRTSRSPARRDPSSSSRSGAAAASARDVGHAAVLEVQEPDHDVGHLHAGVVDVVLDLDRHAVEAQQARPACRRARSSARDRCARPCSGLIAVCSTIVFTLRDRGWQPSPRAAPPAQPAAQERRPVEEHVHIAVRRPPRPG